MNLNYLYYFNVLGQFEHYGKTAEKLHISQSALSQTISKLESELGVSLFVKNGRNIQLTRLGKEYWQQVNYALRSLSIAESNLLLAAKGIGGHINIGFTFVVGSIFFPELIHKFTSLPENQSISFSTFQGDSPEIINAVRDGKCDIGFGTYFKDEPDLKFIPVFRQELVLALPKKHPLTKKERIECKDLLPYPFISFRKNHTLYNMLMTFFESSGVQIRPTYEVTEETTMAGMIASELGIGFIPDSKLLNSFNIEKRHVIGAPNSRFLYICFLDEPNIQSPLTERFIQFVIKTRTLS